MPSLLSFLFSTPSSLYNKDLVILFIAITGLLEITCGALGCYFAIRVECNGRPYTTTLTLSICCFVAASLFPLQYILRNWCCCCCCCSCCSSSSLDSSNSSSDSQQSKKTDKIYASLFRIHFFGILALFIAAAVIFGAVRDDSWTANHPCINHSMVTFIVALVWECVLFGVLVYEYAHLDQIASNSTSKSTGTTSSFSSSSTKFKNVNLNWEAEMEQSGGRV